jgi:ribosomal protein S17
MHRTIVIRREYLHFVPKYDRYEKRHKNLAAHVSPAFRVEEGDQVTVGQCRPLSKTVRVTSFSLPKLRVSNILPDDTSNLKQNVITIANVNLHIGPLQRSPCFASHWQDCQVLQQVLNVSVSKIRGWDL